jgi:phytoene dehydrogenase-like protein
MEPARTIVIGGGLAGLTAAAALARRGREVTVVEGAAHIGGRARSRRRDGFDLNTGPHALYRTGGGRAVLRDLGVRTAGRMPRLDRAGAWVGGAAVPLGRHLRRDVGDRARVVKAMTGLSDRAAAAWTGRPVSEWIASVTDDEQGRLLLASLVRTTTYSAATTLLDAGTVTAHLRTAAHGVVYLHHGWSSLVAGLADVVRSHGGVILTGTPADAVDHDDRVHGVRLADGRTLPAASVVVAVNDARRAAALLDGDAATRLGALAAATVPVRMAHLDLAMRPLPSRRFTALLGIDDAIFLTVPSSVAHVAPPGGDVVQVARYLRPDEEAGDHRPGLEAVLDAHQPDWRDHVVDARYVPRSLVSGDHVRVATGGTGGRATVGAAGVGGLALAGDWIGPVGMLADASILSGAAAAESLLADELVPVARSHARS